MRFTSVLFDWKGTLFQDEGDAAWLRASAASIGRVLTDPELGDLLEGLAEAELHPEVREARRNADCSVEQHRSASLTHFRLAGLDEELAVAVWRRNEAIQSSTPYSDVAPVLQTLRRAGTKIGILSDVHFELLPFFKAHGIEGAISSYTLSFQHGLQKPDPRLFQIALDSLKASPSDALMVGDNPERDTGGVGLGITTLILPPVASGNRRGLDIVLPLLD